MTILTFTTDLGLSSPAAGRLAGLVWQIAPSTQMVELTHIVPWGDVLAAQVVLENAIPYFPEGTIHAVIVGQPAVSRPLAARLGPMLFTGPDIGLITPLLLRAEANRWPVEVYHASNQEYWAGEQMGTTLYAALAAHLASGVPPSALGAQINDPTRVSFPEPELLADGWRGQVLQFDHFGNLVINIRVAHLEGMGALEVRVSGRRIEGLSRTFGNHQPGDLIAIIDSSNRLSICVVNGSAASLLSSRPGDVVEVHTQ
jgi:S-adenosylmethionine hydrolase